MNSTKRLCWTCKRSAAPPELQCSWDRALIPVKGAKTDSEGVIVYCPLYLKELFVQMRRFEKDGIAVKYPADMKVEEALSYVEHLRKKHAALKEVEIRYAEDDEAEIELKFKVKGAPFERIRRITGYLVGTTERWNDAKQAEERDRVKHNL